MAPAKPCGPRGGRKAEPRGQWRAGRRCKRAFNGFHKGPRGNTGNGRGKQSQGMFLAWINGCFGCSASTVNAVLAKAWRQGEKSIKFLAFCALSAVDLGVDWRAMTQMFAPALPIKTTRRRFATGRAVLALMLREMATTYGRSPGGYLWAVLEPVGGIAILTLIFSMGFNAPSLGTNFPIFYATGILPFMMFNSVCNRVSTSLLFSKALLAYPAVTFLDALLARFVVNTVTQAMVGYVVFGGILAIYDTRTLPDAALVAQSFALTAALALGIGTLNAYLIARFAVWQVIWSILTRPLFLISGIFFLFHAIPQPMQDMVWFNPLIHVVGIMRAGFYPTYDAGYVSVVYVLVVSLVSFALGLLLLRRSHRDLLGD